MPTVTVIDYGVGNLLSVARAFERCGARVVLSGDPEQVADADYLVLPGVGAFADGMAGLGSRGLIEPIREFAAKERPFLGICLGMQMMMEQSEEFGIHQGLGLVPGKVVSIPAAGADGRAHKIPHIGWNEIAPPASSSWHGTLLHGTAPGASFYFVHSYAAVPDLAEHRLAECRYGGLSITAVVGRGRTWGCQFHPEKSGRNGLALIESFISTR